MSPPYAAPPRPERLTIWRKPGSYIPWRLSPRYCLSAGSCTDGGSQGTLESEDLHPPQPPQPALPSPRREDILQSERTPQTTDAPTSRITMICSSVSMATTSRDPDTQQTAYLEYGSSNNISHHRERRELKQSPTPTAALLARRHDGSDTWSTDKNKQHDTETSQR